MKYKIWYASDHSMSAKKKQRLFALYRDYKRLYDTSEAELRSHAFLNEKEIEAFVYERGHFPLLQWEDYVIKNNILVVTCMDEDYPKNLKTIPDAPFQLFYKGKLPDQSQRLIAVVGARRCTGYGRNATAMICEMLSAQGYGVVSGMADGIDGIAHEAALAKNGSSYAVLGCGVDVCYPPKHKSIYEALSKKSFRNMPVPRRRDRNFSLSEIGSSPACPMWFW